MRSAFLRRIRAYGGQLALLAVLGLLAGFWVSGVTRLANEITDRGLRTDLGALPHTIRDLTYVQLPGSVEPTVPVAGPVRLREYRDGLPAAIREVAGENWFIGETGPIAGRVGDSPPNQCPPLVSVRWQTGTVEATRIVEGQRPRTFSEPEASIGADAAAALGVGVGDTVRVSAVGGEVPVLISGFHEPVDATAPIWEDMRPAQVSCPAPEDGTRPRVTLLSDLRGTNQTVSGAGVVSLRWRYRLDDAKVTAADLSGLTGAVLSARRGAPAGTGLQTNLDEALSTFEERMRSVRALLAVIQAGILFTLLGLILLAARLAVDRRRDEYALIRARGGSAAAIGVRTLAETAVAVPVAVALGWLAGLLLPGRADPGEPVIVALVGLVALLAAPAVAGLAARHPEFAARRHDLARQRPSVRRLAAEGSVLLFAVLGLVLLRRRGLNPGAGLDPYLVVVPVLIAVSVALLTLRLVPYPLAWLGRLAVRARGVVAFLGLSGAARGAPLSVGPLAALVVAVATGVFTSVVTSTVERARDVATGLSIPADAELTGFRFAADTAQRIAAEPGVTAAVGVVNESGVDLTGADGAVVQVRMTVLDAAAAGWDGLPAELTDARRGDGPVPIVASPEVAAVVPGDASINVQGRAYRVRVVAARDTVPGVGADIGRFVVVPAQALPVLADVPLMPDTILLSGRGYDVDRLLAIADEGQVQRARAGTGRPVTRGQLPVPAALLTHAEARAALDRTGVNGVLSFTSVAAVTTAAALALLTVAFTVLAGAPARGRTLSRLRTMGLSGRQGRRLLVYEMVPLVAAALTAGAVTGIVLPVLVGPALGLGGFTGGVAARLHVDPLLAGGILVLAGLAVAAALAAENVVNRRLRLGEVLRVGEEN